MERDFRIHRCATPGMEAVAARSRHCFARHTHEHFGIGVIDRGGQRWHSRRGQVEARVNDVISVSPGEVHDGDPLSDIGRSWRMLYIDPAFVTAIVADTLDDDRSGFELTRPVISKPRLAGSVRHLFTLSISGEDDLHREELMLAVLAAVGRNGDPKPVIGPHPHVTLALDYINSQLDRKITLGDLARLGELNQFQLLRRFKHATGLPPHAYLLQCRIDLARRLIANGSPLADTASASGFADQSHMTRVFVQRYGVTPGDYSRAVGKFA